MNVYWISKLIWVVGDKKNKSNSSPKDPKPIPQTQTPLPSQAFLRNVSSNVHASMRSLIKVKFLQTGEGQGIDRAMKKELRIKCKREE